jgi:dCMP deaminase
VKAYIGDWHERWMTLAFLASRNSKDPSTKLGVVLVTPANDLITTGWNGFPRGVREQLLVSAGPETNGAAYLGPELDPERWERRPEKYRWVEHAERNAVYNAARLGRPTLGAIAYINADPTPCSDCTRAFIQAGVTRIIGIDKPFTGRGTNVHYHCGDIENTMLDEAGIERVRLPLEPFRELLGG